MMDKALSAPMPSPAPAADPSPPAWPRPVPDLHALPTLGDVLAARLRRGRIWLLAGAALVAGGLLVGKPAWAAAGLVAAAVPPALAAWAYPTQRRYQRLLRHHARGDWDTVRTLARALRGASARRPELDFDLDLRLAGIYARDHGVAEALARLAPWRARLQTRPGAFDAATAAVHLMAGDTGGHLAALARAHAQDPRHAAHRVDLALAEARFGDPDRAQALLAEAGSLPPRLLGRADWAQGLVRLRHRHPDALAMLAGAQAKLADEAQAHDDWLPLAACACDHAIALHQAGRSEAARARIAAAWPVLEHHAGAPLLRMLEADGLLPTRTPPNT